MRTLSLLTTALIMAGTAGVSAEPAKGKKNKQPAGEPAAKPLPITTKEGDDNVFTPDETIRFEVPAPAADGKLTAKVVDFYGKEVWTYRPASPSEAAKSIILDLGKLPNGYYELTAESTTAGKTLSGKATFGVAPMVDRSAADALKGGYRFGLKMGGAPADFDSLKAMNVAARMGLQWTRDRFNRDNMNDLLKLPVNMIYKIELFPPEAYDAKRYGPMEEFKLRHFGWSKATVPLEEPYKKWLKEEVSKLPADATIFEVWNEPWGKLPPVEFAKVAQMTKDAILEVRPDAKVGPNLGKLGYDSDFIKAGGMKGMKMLALHTYGHAERADLRGEIREIRKFYKDNAGLDPEIYVTEFGTPSPPEGPRSSDTEEVQATNGVRSALALYAEDVKGFMPHWLSQTEKSRTDKENWYGYFRANGQPKPALFSMATAARVIDGSTYVGDLFLKPDVGASLFDKAGEFILVLWANDLTIPVEVEVGVPSVKLVNLMGQESTKATEGGKLALTLTGEPVYVVGVSPSLGKLASTELRKDRWVTGAFVRGKREAHRMAIAPVIDGKVDAKEWVGQTTIELKGKNVPLENASGTGYVAWDKEYLYVAADIRDDHPMYNTKAAYSAFDADSIELFICSDERYQIPEFLHTHDFQMLFAPTSDDGKPVAGIVNRDKQKLDEIPGLKMATAKTAQGWAIELAIPLAAIPGFDPVVGHVGAFEMRINDNDPSRANDKAGRFKIDPVDGKPSHQDATVWSHLTLVE